MFKAVRFSTAKSVTSNPNTQFGQNINPGFTP